NDSGRSQRFSLKHLSLILSQKQRNMDSAFCCRQRNALIDLPVRKNSGIIVNAFWFKLFWAFTFPFQFSHTSGNSANGSNCKISRKVKELTNFCITESMQFDGVVRFLFNR